MSDTLHIACGLVWRGDHLLITRRREDTHLGGFWEFPGGKCAPGEAPAETVRRELMEETGLAVTVDEVFHTTRHTYPERTVHLAFYTCSVSPEAEARPLQVAECRWVRPDELQDTAFPPANLALLAKLRSF